MAQHVSRGQDHTEALPSGEPVFGWEGKDIYLLTLAAGAQAVGRV